MQQIQFCREGLHNYMTIACEAVLNRTSYEVVMLELEQIPGLMQYEIRVLDGKTVVYYRLHYRTALKQILGDIRLDIEKVSYMIESIIDVLCQVENYLLNPDFIVWRSDAIFVELNSGKLLFCYYPIQGEDKGSLKNFIVELLQYIDKDDEETYMLTMEFYNRITNPDCSLDKLSQWIRYRMKDGLEDLDKELIIEDTNLRAALQKNDIKKGYNLERFDVSRNQASRNVIMQNIILTVANLVVLLLLFLEIWTYQYVWVLIITLVLLVISLLTTNSFEEMEETDQIMEAYLNQEKEEQRQPLLGGPKKQNEDLYRGIEDNIEQKQQHVSNQSLETTVLTNVQNEIIVEDKPQELYLKSLIPKSYPDIYINKKSVVIGSMQKNCDYVLSKQGISRMHAKIIKKEDGLYMLDMNSTNQTYVNDESLVGGKEYLLNEGDVVSVAGVVNYVVVEER